jgi:signal transduction histidine kinase/ligand-binding sensor domain-containing protein
MNANLHNSWAKRLSGRGMLVLAFLSLLAITRSASAVDPRTPISQYGHTTWRLEDGLLNSAPLALAQGSDGYLWIGTETGLVRFDGVHFQTWTPPGWETIADHQISVLFMAHDGTLWIGTPTNLASWKDGALNVISSQKPLYVNQIAEDRDKNIWFAVSRRADVSLCQVIGKQTKCFGRSDGIPFVIGQRLIANSDGSFTMGTDDTVINWSPASGLISSHTFAGWPPGSAGISALERQADGSLAVGFDTASPTLGLQRLVKDKQSSFLSPDIGDASLKVQALYTDHKGSIWIGTRGDGLYKVSEGTLSRMGRIQGLSGNSVRDIVEDREGNVWVATDGGLDCLRDRKAISWSTDQGLPASYVRSIIATREGTVLVGIDDTVSVIRDGQLSSLSLPDGRPKGKIQAMLEDQAGRYWIGVGDELIIYEHNRLKVVKRPNGDSTGHVFSLSGAPDGSIWAVVYYKSLPRQLIHLQDDKVIDSLGDKRIYLRVASDHKDGVWITGTTSVAHYAHGNIDWIPFNSLPEYKGPEKFSAQDDLAVSADGTVFRSSYSGVWVVRDHAVQLMGSSSGLPCQDVSGLVLSQTESLWMRTSCGLVEVDRASIEKWWSKTNAKIHYRLIDTFDGARLSRSLFFPQMTLASDGRVWIGNENGIEVVDPDHLNYNALPPSVHVEALVANHQEFQPTTKLVIGPHVTDVEVRYTALSLGVPQKVMFRYMLEGRQSTWQDAGARRAAFYSDLTPGHYRFHVIASNNDGVWNNVGDALEFDVEPAWFQTAWFRAFTIVFAIFIMWVAYRLRVNYVAASIKAGFKERLNERTRVARDLHDTVLQTVQSSKMIADRALMPGTDETRMRTALEHLSSWLGRATTEGRSAVFALRASTMDHSELAEGLHTQLKEACEGHEITAGFTILGDPRRPNSVVRDEICSIVREAITNTCKHADAAEVALELCYGATLRVVVRDNGIGISEDALKHGKVGHFGIQGMKERAARIGGAVSISRSRNGGTEMSFVIPGDIAFRQESSGPFVRLLSFFGWNHSA